MGRKKKGMERVIAEYEKIAFEEEGVKTADRLRALEQYAKYAAGEDAADRGGLTVCYDYGDDGGGMEA